jgi:23S rRNA pseudouridine2605 synthase
MLDMYKSAMRKIGLARAMSKLGICSRSQAAERVHQGRVRLNGIVRRDPEWPVHLGKDRIELDDSRLQARERIYLMLNKPPGLVTTARDEKGRDTIFSVLGADLPFVAPVGRLDKASEGLLLLTNDSEWAQKLLDPETHLTKNYHVQISGLPDDALLRCLHAGVVDQDELLRAKSVRVLRSGSKNAWLEIVLEEGKNRHIRRMLKGCGREVLRLVRVAIGSLELGDLPKGQHRPLTRAEKQSIDRQIQPARSAANH